MTRKCQFGLLLFLLIGLCANGVAQKKYLEIKWLDSQRTEVLPQELEQWYKDSLDLLSTLHDFYKNLHKQSYLSASIDKIEWKEDTAFSTIYVGEKYQWATLHYGALERKFVQQLTYKEKYFNGRPIRQKELIKLENSILKYAENNGYPFAQVKLDSISYTNKGIEASLKYIPGPRISFDTIQISGNTEVKKKFIVKYIRIDEGELFSQQKMEDAGFLLKNIPAIKVKRPPEATFYNNKSVVKLYLDHRKNNQFYGIVGILPNEGNDNKVLVTGEVNLQLTNVFNSAKVIKAEWKKLKPLSQFLDISYQHPNLLGTNIDVKLALNLLKEDTTFLNVERLFGFRYNMGREGSVSFIARYKTGRLLSTGQYNLSNPPEYLDTDFWSYGVNYSRNNLDDLYQPKKGTFMELEVGVGNKKIKKNAGIEESVYDNVLENSLQLKLNGKIEQYHQTGKQAVLAHKFNFGTLQNENIVLNEAFRIGGYQTLRGFVENEFFATTYLLSNLEYRVFTDEYSYVFLLYDQAFLSRNILGSTYEDFPLGVGAGINVLTPAGYLTFIYSVGAAKNQPISFNRSKIHFGLVSIF